MAIDPYASCPCGSGKSFKWCCQPFYHYVDKARDLLQSGQAEAGLRTIEQLVAKYPNNAVVLGYEAEFYYLIDQPQKADESIQQALALDPNMPMCHWLRGLIRTREGENVGALIELRKAAELYDPKAKGYLSKIHAGIFDLEMFFNRPLAARYAIERSLQSNPTQEEIRQTFEAAVVNNARLPECARKSYSYRTAPSHRVEAWKSVLPNWDHTVRLTQAIKAFEQLVEQDAQDAPAWFNLGLARAWLGDHPRAIEALSRSIDLDSDEALTTEASILCEVLKCGEGMEEEGDYADYSYLYQVKNFDAVFDFIQKGIQAGRFIVAQVDKEQVVITVIMLAEIPAFSSAISAGVAPALAIMTARPQLLVISHSSEDALDRAADELEASLGDNIGEPRSAKEHVEFADVALEAMAYTPHNLPFPEIETKVREHIKNFFENVWVHRSFRTLSGATPLDAASHPSYRKRLGGLIQFIQECLRIIAPVQKQGGESRKIEIYDFDRLRRKLGLLASVADSNSGDIDFDILSVNELANLSAQEWNAEQLERAYRAAMRLDAKDLAGKFAKLAIDQPGVPGADRFPFYMLLLQLAQAQNDSEALFRLLEQGEQSDRDFNESRRRQEYALRRAQLLANQGDVEKATAIFSALIAEHPHEMNHLLAATETMIGQKQGAQALIFAEQGLAKARSLNSRDLEQHFLELVAASQKISELNRKGDRHLLIGQERPLKSQQNRKGDREQKRGQAPF